MTTWSHQQNEAMSLAAAWIRIKHKPVFRLFGYAGTGKTTLAMYLASLVDGRVAFAAYTGKAASVMKAKGCWNAKTIHRMIYETFVDPLTGKATSTLRPFAHMEKYSLIIIDECSMVDEEVGRDLLSFGKPVLVLGDPAQLPPVKGGGFFTNQQPDYLLTDVHRQAAESPIIRLATDIREGRWNRELINTPGLIVCTKDTLQQGDVTGADIVIVGRNETRMKYNQRLRQLAKITHELPRKGEQLICLRNDKEKSIYNGEIYTVEKARAGKVGIKLELLGSEGGLYEVDVRKEFFRNDVEAQKIPFKQLRGTQQFTFGYAITCHKSQGSQWDNVCVFDESRALGGEPRRWLYTAVTRAAEHLTLVI